MRWSVESRWLWTLSRFTINIPVPDRQPERSKTAGWNFSISSRGDNQVEAGNICFLVCGSRVLSEIFGQRPKNCGPHSKSNCTNYQYSAQNLFPLPSYSCPVKGTILMHKSKVVRWRRQYLHTAGTTSPGTYSSDLVQRSLMQFTSTIQ